MNKQIYIVGGSIRDQCLGLQSNDIDYVAVGYSMQHFENLGYAQIGLDFPVFLTPEGEELALARRERKIHTGYSGFQTDTINVTLEEDLGRRDLTINSIAKHPTTGALIDPYNGLKDIEDKYLRHTSEAFSEDPVRVLRLARFKARFPEFKIHKTTKVLVYNMREELQSLQRDRVWKEVEKVLQQNNSYIFFETLFELGVLDVVFPHIYALTTLKEGNKHHLEASVFDHTMRMLKIVDENTIILKLAVLFHDIAKPYTYRTVGDSSGHDTCPELNQYISEDLQVPAKVLHNIEVLCENHVRLYRVPVMTPGKVATFIASYKRNNELFENQILLGLADDKGRATLTEVKDINIGSLMALYKDISTYSPIEWIQDNTNSHQEHQASYPSNEAIKNHIHNYNISQVKKYYERT